MNNPQTMTTEINSEIVKEFGLNAGANVVGIAASKDFGLAPDGFKPSDKLEDCLSVVVLGAPFPQEALSANLPEYTDIRNEMLKKMDSVSKDVAKQIKGKGYKVTAVGGVGGKYVNGKFFGHISLKHAAELAGLGVIGRNYLLTNPEHGNLLWFSAVLTNADLVPDKRAEYTICNNCNRCVKMCPSKALENPALFGAKECNKECWKMVNRKWELNCFLCRKVCPYRFGKIN
jgi:epoxyqueuosine reductase QueG